MKRSASVKAQLRSSYLQEPLLSFADGGLHVSPKSGIARFGPTSYSPRADHPDQVRVGMIGSASTIAALLGKTERAVNLRLQRRQHADAGARRPASRRKSG